MPEGLGYTVAKVDGNNIKITLTGSAKTAPTTVSNIGIVVKASGIEETNGVDSSVFNAVLNPFEENIVIDYTPLSDGVPFRDVNSHSNIAFTAGGQSSRG